ncbi:hypothetical protein BB559_002862 [Furculomyces boomerangus]|uniref:RNA polymerase III subunit Rpc25 domain-containing protein n=2 Tax=Harpellales TaxID=61421 RepID=A0A2T9YRJ7_9FUNG|nr:hypothetical protein BB559_004597 [Furculomyces boomerangus]PVU94980.1 hypothetical protein BB559_002862 [Furculomyces boomerangus]PVZ98488.1 hypothetical protein BB558_005514 [Smittium angustum]
MFILTKISDNIRVRPWNFNKDRKDAIADEINKKYANKASLIIRLFDVLEMNEGYIQHSEGSVWSKVVFRLVVFRPFGGEIVEAKILSCNPSGIKATLQFFSDIWIPKELLREGTEYDSVEGVFVWKYEGQEFFLDIDEQIKCRVVEGTFIDSNPPRPKVHQNNISVVGNNVSGGILGPGNNSVGTRLPESNMGSINNPNQSTSMLSVANQPIPLSENNVEPYTPPYLLTCSMSEDGLGPTSWW